MKTTIYEGLERLGREIAIEDAAREARIARDDLDAAESKRNSAGRIGHFIHGFEVRSLDARSRDSDEHLDMLDGVRTIMASEPYMVPTDIDDVRPVPTDR